jgi:hypothetical protein
MNPPARGLRGAGSERESRDASTSVRADSIARGKHRFLDFWRSGRMPCLCYEEVTTGSHSGIRRLARAGEVRQGGGVSSASPSCGAPHRMPSIRRTIPVGLGRIFLRAAKRLRRAETLSHVSTPARCGTRVQKGFNLAEFDSRKFLAIQALQTGALAPLDESRRMRTRLKVFPDESTRNVCSRRSSNARRAVAAVRKRIFDEY